MTLLAGGLVFRAHHFAADRAICDLVVTAARGAGGGNFVFLDDFACGVAARFNYEVGGIDRSLTELIGERCAAVGAFVVCLSAVLRAGGLYGGDEFKGVTEGRN